MTLGTRKYILCSITGVEIPLFCSLDHGGIYSMSPLLYHDRPRRYRTTISIKTIQTENSPSTGDCKGSPFSRINHGRTFLNWCWGEGSGEGRVRGGRRQCMVSGPVDRPILSRVTLPLTSGTDPLRDPHRTARGGGVGG